NLQAHLSRLIGDDVETVVIPLEAKFIFGARTENVVPRGLKIVVVVVNRTAGRKTRKRLHVRVLLQVVAVAVGERNGVYLAEAMIKTSGRQILARGVR